MHSKLTDHTESHIISQHARIAISKHQQNYLTLVQTIPLLRINHPGC